MNQGTASTPTTGELAELIASFLTDVLENNDAIYGVLGPVDQTRVIVAGKRGCLLVVDVAEGEFTPS